MKEWLVIVFKLLFVVPVVCLISSCSDDQGAASIYDGATLSSESDLPSCSTYLEGLTVFVQETNGYYVCEYSLWKKVKEKAKTEEDLKASITYGELKDSRDGQVYKTVEIGDQVWMAQNLNYNSNFKDANGDYVGNSWCGGGEDEKNREGDCSVYGRLYTWSAAMDSAGILNPNGSGKGCGYAFAEVIEKNCHPTGRVQGICPSGWHLPSKEEFETLISFVKSDGISETGYALMSTSSLWQRLDGSSHGLDTYGFSALPAGYFFCITINCSETEPPMFSQEGDMAHFWSSTLEFSYVASSTSPYIYSLWLMYGSSYADVVDAVSARYGYSVRCLKD